MRGSIYYNGEGVAQDYAEAAKWNRLAADQGDAMGQSNRGLMYQDGKGVLQDFLQAAKWFRLAAGQGGVHGQRNRALLNRDGKGVAANSVVAYAWLNLAAVGGHPKAFGERNTIAANLTSTELLRAQQLSANWKTGELIPEGKAPPKKAEREARKGT